MRQNKWSAGAAAALCGELALILRAGLPLAESLEAMSEDRGGDALLTGLAACVAEGAPLSQAMEENGAFPAYLTAMVACGEKTGRLEEALDALAEHYDSRSRLEAGLTAALVQPTLLALAMLAVMVVLLTRVLPVFREIYASLGGTLSGPAVRLLAVGQVLNRALPMLAVLLAAVLAFLGAFALCAPFRDRVTALWQRRDRGLARETAAAGIAQALSLGMRSGLPVEESLELAAGLQGENTPAARRCRDCRRRLEAGEGLAESFSALFPGDCCRLLAAGARAGAADTVMQQMACRLRDRSEARLSAALGRVEPAMVLLSALLVGTVLLTVLLPLLNILAAIG